MAGTLPPAECSGRTAQLTRIYRDEYIAPIPESERHDLILAYHAQLNSVDDEVRIRAAKAWSKWEYVFSQVN